MNFLRRLFSGSKPSGGANSDYIEPRSGLAFPVVLAGLARQETGRTYSEGDRTGESMSYGNPEVQATVYITTVGQTRFPDGGESAFILEQVEAAMAAVGEMERLGHYQRVKFFKAGPERLGSDPRNLIWARSAFFAWSGDRPMISFTYITALQNRVIKLRISGADPKNPKLMEFPHALGDLICRQITRPSANN